MILRSCNLGDCVLMDQWDPNGEMWVGDKLEWLTKRMSDSVHHRLYVGEIGLPSQPVAWGQIKLEFEYCTLAWFVAPIYRSAGFGARMGQLLALMCAGRSIRARINANRPYSERIAISLGMVPEGGLLETGEKWWVRR